MALLERLQSDMKTAMKARDKARLTTIRGMIAVLKKAAIDGQKTEFSEAEEVSFLTKQAKQRRESITAFRDADREELAVKEEAELKVIEEYLPEQLSDAEAEAKIQAIIARVGATSSADLGKVMGAAMGELKGKYPGKDVRVLAAKLLS